MTSAKPILNHRDQELLTHLRSYDATIHAAHRHPLKCEGLKRKASTEFRVLFPLLEQHEVPLLDFPTGFRHLIEEIEGGRRHLLTKEGLLERFPTDYPLVNNAQYILKNASSTALTIVNKAEPGIEGAAQKIGSKNKWLIVGGIAVAIIAVGAFMTFGGKNKAEKTRVSDLPNTQGLA